ncbi:hypothetical protein KIK06_15005 [Nocardiopsis sp. EMB25]|nr:hypothetical protein [Nocardiopsis sp. EMB25]
MTTRPPATTTKTNNTFAVTRIPACRAFMPSLGSGVWNAFSASHPRAGFNPEMTKSANQLDT